MRAYGTRKRPTRYGGAYREHKSSTVRANRGRTRSSAMWRNRTRALPHRNQSALDRTQHKTARQDARHEIASELCLWDLEQELDGLSARGAYLSTGTRHLRVVGVEDVLQDEPRDVGLDYGWDDRDRDYWHSDCKNDCWVCNNGYAKELQDNELRDQKHYDDYDYDDDDPVYPSWANLWVAGVVHDEEGRDSSWYDHYDAWCDNEDHHDMWRDVDWAEISNSNYLSHVDPQLRADEDRNAERLRAGERYYHQNKRTVSK